jgi:hypothetical protein
MSVIAIGRNGDDCVAQPLVLRVVAAGPMLVLRPHARTREV